MFKKIIDKRNYIILIIIIILLIGIIFTKTKPNNYTKEFNYLGEKIIVNLYQVKNSEEIFQNIDKIYKKYDNFYKNQDKNTDKDFIKLLKYGKKLYKKSAGLIDITSKELLENITEEKEINYETNIQNLNFKDEKTLTNINTDSIIGAYATNKVVKYLKKAHIKNYLINEDGNIIVGKKGKDKFKISIIDKEGKVVEILDIKNKSIAVKGNTTTLKPYMINPKTSSKNKTNDLIVVIDKNINKANAYANTLYLMGQKERKNYIKKHRIKALYQEDDKTIMTKSFKKYLK